MANLLHASFLRGEGDPLNESIDSYLEALERNQHVVATAPYVLVGAGPKLKPAEEALARLDDHPVGTDTPGAFVLAEFEEMKPALDHARALSTADGPVSLDSEPFGVFSQALWWEIEYISGPLDDEMPGFAPAVQFGNLGVKTVRDEWRLSEWYEDTRYPVVAELPSSVRSRRYLSVAGRAKFAVLYEFASIEGRTDDFEEAHEVRLMDDDHPTSELRRYTVHAPGAPFVGRLR